MYRKGRVALYMYPHRHSHAQRVPTIARHMAPFFSRRVRLRAFPHGEGTATRVHIHAWMRTHVCVYICLHSDARTDASVKLFEFSME